MTYFNVRIVVNKLYILKNLLYSYTFNILFIFEVYNKLNKNILNFVILTNNFYGLIEKDINKKDGDVSLLINKSINFLC